MKIISFWVLMLGFVLCIVSQAESKTYHVKNYNHRHGRGLKRTTRSKEFLLKKKERLHAVPIPDTLPVSVNLAPKVSPPEDQGNCGACWDFALTKALRSAKMLAGTDAGRLAFNYLLNNCGPGPKMYGCDGGDFDAGESMLLGSGPWLEVLDPYRAVEGDCKNLPVSGTAVDFKLVGDGRTKPTFQQLAYAVSQNHMLAIDVAADGRWSSYSGGIYNSNSSSSINHMINLVGYDCQTSVSLDGRYCRFGTDGNTVNHDGYLIVMNNWGNEWGEQGYMRTRYGMNAVAETAMYFDVVLPQPTPPVPQPDPQPVPTPIESTVPWWVWMVIAFGIVGTSVFAVLSFKNQKSLEGESKCE